jgi:hypothetical protein
MEVTNQKAEGKYYLRLSPAVWMLTREMKIKHYEFLILTLDAAEWSESLFNRVTPRRKNPDTRLSSDVVTNKVKLSLHLIYKHSAMKTYGEWRLDSQNFTSAIHKFHAPAALPSEKSALVVHVRWEAR